MGWCLKASFEENPKSMTIAYAGGASGIYLANFFFSRLDSRSSNSRLLHAGGFISAVGVSWCLNVAFAEHPHAAVKACLAGALSICLTKSVIFDNLSVSFKETPEKSKTTPKRIPDTSTPLPGKSATRVVFVGRELNEIAKDFERRKSGEYFDVLEEISPFKACDSVFG